jgi:hypothetical protein
MNPNPNPTEKKPVEGVPPREKDPKDQRPRNEQDPAGRPMRNPTDSNAPRGDTNNPNRPMSPIEDPDAFPVDDRQPSGETPPTNPTLPRYGDKEPNDPRKTDATAKRKPGETKDTSHEAGE